MIVLLCVMGPVVRANLKIACCSNENALARWSQGGALSFFVFVPHAIIIRGTILVALYLLLGNGGIGRVGSKNILLAACSARSKEWGGGSV